jgi:hypothetical protein
METHIPAIYEKIKKELLDSIADSAVALATDGWKKKAAGQGVPLINVMVHPPDGGSFFYKVTAPNPCTTSQHPISRCSLASECMLCRPSLPQVSRRMHSG